MTHLILHKVRGEPAYDIAQELQIGDELGWIIPTSGHRAYPYKTWSLDELKFDNSATIPEEWPDHYQIDKGTALPSGVSVMQAISGLFPKIRRRV
jgi:hypothetical protein